MRARAEIFKKYDIRGIYPEEIDEKTARKMGGVFVNMLWNAKPPKIVVGRDLRRSSKPLAKSFIAGAIGAGADIIDVGEVTTPMLYFSVGSLNADGGAMITASHNPPKHNGIKMVRKNGMAVSGEEIKSKLAKKYPKRKKGEAKKYEISKKHFSFVLKNFKPVKKLKISVETKGAAKLFKDELMERLGASPSKRPDFSVSFDYDADRLIILGKNGKEIRGDILGIAIGDMVAKKSDTIVYDLRCSRAVPEYFRSKGVRAIPSKVGHANIKKLMREKSAVFGMEITGHYYFKKLNFHESPFFALRKFIEYLGRNGTKVQNLERELGKYFHSGVINIKTGDAGFEKIAKKLRREYSNGAQNTLDGLSIEFSTWWLNIRKSHTEPLVRLVVEATNEKAFEERKKEVLKIVKEST